MLVCFNAYFIGRAKSLFLTIIKKSLADQNKTSDSCQPHFLQRCVWVHEADKLTLTARSEDYHVILPTAL